MKTKTIAMTLALCFMTVTLCFASPHIGTWVLNEAKSKFPPMSGKNTKVVYEAMDDAIAQLESFSPVCSDSAVTLAE